MIKQTVLQLPINDETQYVEHLHVATKQIEAMTSLAVVLSETVTPEEYNQQVPCSLTVGNLTVEIDFNADAYEAIYKLLTTLIDVHTDDFNK